MDYRIPSILILLWGAVCLLPACSDERGKSVEPDIGKVCTMKSTSVDCLEFCEIFSGTEVKGVSEEDEALYFGKRVERNAPTELCFTDDSLLVVKPHGVTEKYKVLWREREADEVLLLHNTVSDTWEYAGKRGEDGLLHLSIGYYRVTSADGRLTVWGQGYRYTSYQDVLVEEQPAGEDGASLVWMRKQYNFK